jgi:hypothetical protein
MKIGGLTFFERDSGGGLGIVSYHPLDCPTWHWAVSILRRQPEANWWVSRDPKEAHQRHSYYWLPFQRVLCISRQDWHKCTAGAR